MYKAVLRDELVAVKVFPVGKRAKGEVCICRCSFLCTILSHCLTCLSHRSSPLPLPAAAALTQCCCAAVFSMPATIHFTPITCWLTLLWPACMQENFRKEIALLQNCADQHIVGFRAA